MAVQCQLAIASLLLVAYVSSFNDADYPEIDLPFGVNIPHMDKSGDINADPKPCCLPKQWQGNVTSQVGTAGGRRGPGSDENRRGPGRGRRSGESMMVFVDETNKKVASRGAAGRSHNETAGFVMTFGTNNTATAFFFNLNKQKCWKKSVPKAEFKPQCIPANATYKGEFKIGPATGGLSVQSWLFRAKKEGDHGKFFVGGRILVVPTGCVPVLVQDHGMFMPGPGPRPGPHTDNEITFDQTVDDSDRPGPGPHRGPMMFMANMYFSNIEASIKDPSVFTPPSYCNNATMAYDERAMEGYDDLLDVLDRFVDTA